jgi:hypothetical protein
MENSIYLTRAAGVTILGVQPGILRELYCILRDL